MIIEEQMYQRPRAAVLCSELSRKPVGKSKRNGHVKEPRYLVAVPDPMRSRSPSLVVPTGLSSVARSPDLLFVCRNQWPGIWPLVGKWTSSQSPHIWARLHSILQDGQRNLEVIALKFDQYVD